jgi:L-ribulose-5-phosphate 3-epimerase
MTGPSSRIGFMQGRLSPLVDGRIQAFPWDHWRDEFRLANPLGFERMEWTLDQDNLYANPLMQASGQAEIRYLAKTWNLAVTSITGDCFMQAPFWKANGPLRDQLLLDLVAIVQASSAIGAKLIVIPLVDNGALESAAQEGVLRSSLLALQPLLSQTRVGIAFETDLDPDAQMAFIQDFPAEHFGINFDIGNSASLGWAPRVEIPRIASRLINVHVKDRRLGGTTVPLGEGDADLATVFALLDAVGYAGQLILQTARAADGKHCAAARRYRDLIIDLMAAA